MNKATIVASFFALGAAAFAISLSGLPLDEEAQAQTTPTPVRVTEPDWDPYQTRTGFLTMMGGPTPNCNRCLLSQTCQYARGDSFVAMTWGDAEREIFTSMTGSASGEKGVRTQSFSDDDATKEEKQKEIKEKQAEKADKDAEVAGKDAGKGSKEERLGGKEARRDSLIAKDGSEEVLTPAELDELSQLHGHIFELQVDIAELSGDLAELHVQIDSLEKDIFQLKGEIQELSDEENQDSSMPSEVAVAVPARSRGVCRRRLRRGW